MGGPNLIIIFGVKILVMSKKESGLRPANQGVQKSKKGRFLAKKNVKIFESGIQFFFSKIFEGAPLGALVLTAPEPPVEFGARPTMQAAGLNTRAISTFPRISKSGPTRPPRSDLLKNRWVLHKVDQNRRDREGGGSLTRKGGGGVRPCLLKNGRVFHRVDQNRREGDVQGRGVPCA